MVRKFLVVLLNALTFTVVTGAGLLAVVVCGMLGFLAGGLVLTLFAFGLQDVGLIHSDAVVNTIGRVGIGLGSVAGVG